MVSNFIIRIHVVRGLIFSGYVAFHSPLPLLYNKLTYTGRGLVIYFYGVLFRLFSVNQNKNRVFCTRYSGFWGFCSGFKVLPEQELLGMSRAKSRIKPSSS